MGFIDDNFFGCSKPPMGVFWAKEKIHQNTSVIRWWVGEKTLRLAYENGTEAQRRAAANLMILFEQDNWLRAEPMVGWLVVWLVGWLVWENLKQFDGMFFFCFGGFWGNGVNLMKSKSGGPTPVGKSSRMTSCFNDLNWYRSCLSTSSLSVSCQEICKEKMVVDCYIFSKWLALVMGIQGYPTPPMPAPPGDKTFLENDYLGTTRVNIPMILGTISISIIHPRSSRATPPAVDSWKAPL